MFILSQLSFPSLLRSQFCLLPTLPPHVERAAAHIMPFTVRPFIPAAPTIRLVLTRPAPAPRPFAPPTGTPPFGLHAPPPRPHRRGPAARAPGPYPRS